VTPEQELLQTIDEIRAKHYADLPADLVKRIVQTERDFTDNRQEAHKRIGQAIDDYLASLSTGAKG
jgi:hypothetical protein